MKFFGKAEPVKTILDGIDIDLDEEIAIVEKELKEIGIDLPQKRTMNIEDFYKAAYSIYLLTAENFNVTPTKNFDELRKKIKIFDIHDRRECLKRSFSKYDTLLYGAGIAFAAWQYSEGYVFVPTGLLVNLGFLGLFKLYGGFRPTPGRSSRGVTLPYEEDYDFYSSASHEIAHLVDKGSGRGHSPFTPFNKIRRDEGIAEASEHLTLRKLYEQTGDVNFRRLDLLSEYFILTKAKTFEGNPYRHSDKYAKAGRMHIEGRIIMHQLEKKYGDSALPRASSGEFDNYFSFP